MLSTLIGIAGGSGAGKSTVCYRLVDDFPDRFEVINLDDYQKKKTEPNLPMIDGKINWDHPDIIDWNKLLADVRTLLSGKPVTIDVWSHRSNPGYAIHGKMLPRTIYPKPVLLLEGYFALYNPTLNKLYGKKFYLDLNADLRNAQRFGKDMIIGDDTYVERVVIPMHEKYVEPTKKNADQIIDVSDMFIEEIAQTLLEAIT